MYHLGRLLRIPETATGLAALSFVLTAFVYSGVIHFERLVPSHGLSDPVLPGLTTEPLSPKTPGLVVTSVRDQSEAQRKGVTVGDDILSVNDVPAKSSKSRSYYLSKTTDGLLRLQLRHSAGLRTVVLHPVAR